MRILFSEDGGSGGGSGATGVATTQQNGGSTNGNADVSKLLEKIEALESNSRNLVEEKRTLAAKLKAIEDDKAIKDGDLQKLLEDKNKEYNELQAQYNEATSKATAYDTYLKDRRETLRSKLTDEDDKAIFDGISDLTKQELFVEKKTKAKAVDTDSGNGGSKIQLTEAQKKEAKEMFPYMEDEGKRLEYYIHAKKLNKKE